jgi:hypothetical protein
MELLFHSLAQNNFFKYKDSYNILKLLPIWIPRKIIHSIRLHLFSIHLLLSAVAVSVAGIATDSQAEWMVLREVGNIAKDETIELCLQQTN